VRTELAVVVLVFIVTSVITYLAPQQFKVSAKEDISGLMKVFKGLMKRLGLTSALILPAIIMYNNLRVVFLNLALGITIVGPLVITAYNAYIIASFVSHGNVVENLVLVLPHGVVELSAILLSAALGLRLGLNIVVRRRSSVATIKEVLRYIPLVMMLLLVAALIESYVTPLIYVGMKIVSGELPLNLSVINTTAW